MGESTRSKLPVPLIRRRSVSGSPPAGWAGDTSVDAWNPPTAPEKSLGRPSVGNDRTFRSDGGLAIVMSLGLMPLYRPCRKGAPILAAMEMSSCDTVLILTLIGASADRENSPGLTAESTLCQVISRNWLPPITSSRRSGCLERLLSVKSPPVSVGSPFSEVTIPGRNPTSISTGTLSPTYTARAGMIILTKAAPPAFSSAPFGSEAAVFGGGGGGFCL